MSARPLDRFYPIVADADWVARMIAAGARLIQLRAKGMEPAELRRHIARARDLCAAAGAQLVVNDHWALALELGCDFVHLGQSDLDGADLAALRRAGVRLGVSTHDEAERARALETQPDYVALGPIYPTVLKHMPWAPQGLERIGAWKRAIGARPLVAIGGLTIERARLCLAAGAQSAAVVTDIVTSQEPEARARAWRAALGSV